MPIEASFIALFRSASLAWKTRYFAVSLVGRSMSSLSRAFFGLRQWMPFLTLTTWLTRQSETVAISFSARLEERRVGKESIYQCDWSSDVCSSDLLLVARVLRVEAVDAFLDVDHLADAAVRNSRHQLLGQIGRASCREREYISV